MEAGGEYSVPFRFSLMALDIAKLVRFVTVSGISYNGRVRLMDETASRYGRRGLWAWNS